MTVCTCAGTAPGYPQHEPSCGRPEMCDVCYGDAAECDCAEWAAYWASLTPEQQRREQDSMDRYADENQGAR